MFGRKSAGLSYLLLLLLPLIVCGATGPKAIEDLAELNNQISNGDNKKVGFLSHGNYQTVHNVLDEKTEPVIFPNVADMEAAVDRGEVIAGMVSGVPLDKYHHFSSTLVSPRAMLAARDEVIRILDAAIVRVIERGDPQRFALENVPFEMVSVFNCKRGKQENAFAFPEIASPAATLKIGALGPSNWGVDGDYTADPPVGYWPSYYNAIDNEVQQYYNGSFAFERVWYGSSAEILDALVAGAIDATEPYMTVDAFYGEQGRKEATKQSCITMGYDSTFFTAKADEGVQTVNEMSAGAIAGVTIAAVSAVLGVFFILYLVRRERENKPVFKPLREEKTYGLSNV